MDIAALPSAVAAAAELVAGRLPGAFAASAPEDRLDAVTGAGEGALALSAEVGDGARIVLILPAAVISALGDGAELADVLTPIVGDAAAALAPALGDGLNLEAPAVLPADLALDSLRACGGPIAAVTLSSEEGDGLLAVALPAAELDLMPITGGGRPDGRDVAPEALDLLGDVEMAVTAVLGRTRLTVRHLLGLTVGHVVELDRNADSAVDLLVNGTLVARGEVVVVDDEFAVRITEIVNKTARS
jgi:flagellar motor switch protein FliN/FliY